MHTTILQGIDEGTKKKLLDVASMVEFNEASLLSVITSDVFKDARFSPSKDDNAESDVPISMQEIYRLSNMNRKKNKEKKKMKEETTGKPLLFFPISSDEYVCT